MATESSLAPLFLFSLFLLICFVLTQKIKRKEAFEDQKQQTVGAVSMIKKPKNIETWLEKNRAFGITKFYIRLEETPELHEYLRSQSDVYFTDEVSKGVDEYNDIQVRQINWINTALGLARNDGVTWLIHIDSDELLDGDIKSIFQLPETIDTFWIQNVEALYKGIPKEEDNCFEAASFVDCASPGAACVSYVNGKAGGRTKEGISAHGPHRFKSNRPNSEQKIETIKLQHYESCDFKSYKEKYTRLAQSAKMETIPFPYYKDSIKAANKGDEAALECVYKKYRTETKEDKNCDELLL
jgi:hypothetical protein